MRANFICGFENGQIVLPPMDDMEGGQCLVYTDEDGIRHGGFTIISYAPAPSVIAQVHSSPEVIEAMKIDAKYVWLEDVAEVDDVA